MMLSATEKWLQNVVIQHNLCPFAKREWDLGRVRLEVIDSVSIEAGLQKLISECRLLDNDLQIETTLLIFSQSLKNFEDYLDFLAMAEDLLVLQGYEGIYQLASFHPAYCFEGLSHDDPANYTNRSPYPMLHLLRETSLEKALQQYPNPESIPKRNVALMGVLGLSKMQNLLKACYKEKGV